MERKYTPDHVGRRFGVSRTTVVEWCEAGVMPAINVASPSATNRRWRMSEDDIAAFESRRENRQAVMS